MSLFVFVLTECYLIFLLVFPIAMEESSSAAQRITPISKQKPQIAVPKSSQNKEYKDVKKDFEARLWVAVKCTQSYSGETSGTTGSKVWFYPYCKMQKSGSVARVRWHFLGMGKNEQISVCNNVPSIEKDSIQKQFNEKEKLKQFDEFSIQTNNSATRAMLGGPQTSSQLLMLLLPSLTTYGM